MALIAVHTVDARTLQQNPSLGDIFGSIAQTVGQGINGVVPLATGALNIANQTATGAVSSVAPNTVPPGPPMVSAPACNSP